MKFFVIDKRPKDGPREQFRTNFTLDGSVATDDAPRCPVCSAFVGMLRAVPPIRVHLETWGEDFGDCAFWMDSFLVSARFREHFTSSALKGLSGFDKAEVLSHRRYGKVRGAPPEYFLVRPKTGAARIDVVASGIERTKGTVPSCEYCQTGAGSIERWRSVIVDENSWEGDDLFYAYGLSGALLASARFVTWARDYDFRNLWLRPSEESAHDFYPCEKRGSTTRRPTERG